MSSQPVVRIGARGSKLSLTQSRTVQRAIALNLGVAPDAPIEEVERVAPLTVITTTGDRVQDRRLLEVGGKALFTKEIEEALLDGRIDCAIHSMKDMPAELPPGLAIAAVPVREDVRDALIGADSLAALPSGARLGTASLRRQAQALYLRPDLEIVMMRGNVDTRLAKLQAGECDALLLAAAGLNRLGLSGHIRDYIDSDLYANSPGQGALAVQCRTEDLGAEWMRKLHHQPTHLCIQAERGALEALEASCRTAVGAYARIDGDDLHLFVEALSGDGSVRWQRRAVLNAPDITTARNLGLSLGEDIRAEAGDDLILVHG